MFATQVFVRMPPWFRSRVLVLCAVLCYGLEVRAEQRICICSIPDIPVCQKACAAPPKEEIKVVTLPGVPGPTPISTWQYEPLFPAYGYKGAPNAAVAKALQDDKLRSLMMKEFADRAGIAAAYRKYLDDQLKEGKIPEAVGKKAIQQFDLDALRYEQWGAAFGAIEAREKLGIDLKNWRPM